MAIENLGGLPNWVREATWPIWVSSSDGRLCFVNEAAHQLLGDAARGGAGCHLAVRGYTDEGRGVCTEQCPLRAAADNGRAQHAWRMHVGDPLDEDSWALVFPMSWRSGGSGSPALIHCAFGLGREQRMEDYVRRVASRSGEPHDGCTVRRLTTREHEILDLLGRDIDAQAIAMYLRLSYATIRNHIQHILMKLDVHSTEEAVARWLLDE